MVSNKVSLEMYIHKMRTAQHIKKLSIKIKIKKNKRWRKKQKTNPHKALRLPSSAHSRFILKIACFEPSGICRLWIVNIPLFLCLQYICFELIFSFVSIHAIAMSDGLLFCFKGRKTSNATHFHRIFPLESIQTVGKRT